MSRPIDVIDSCVLIQGVQQLWGDESRIDPDMSKRAMVYLDSFDPKGPIPVIPSVVMAEILGQVEPNLRSEVWEFASRNFIVAPFDARAAELGARAQFEAIRGRGERKRYAVKVDGMIIGTALAVGASRIVTFNMKDFHMAPGQIQIIEPPMLALAQQLDFGAPAN